MNLVLPIFFEERSKFSLVPKTRVRENTSYVNKRLFIIYLPAFSVDVVWRGASEIVKEFLYNVGTPLSFLKITQPSDPNFVAMVAWKPTANTIVRYKLWNNVGEILYYPLYSGQTIGAEFSIEIWNTKPDVIPGGILTTEDGQVLITEDDAWLITEGSEIGTEETISFDGVALFHTSKMLLPTSYCEPDFNSLDDPTVCTDMTFDLRDFIPFDGDYYSVEGNCGVTVLIKGVRLVADSFKLYYEPDDTWHNVFIGELQNEKMLFIDPTPTTPGVLPTVKVAHFITHLGHEVSLSKLQGEFVLLVNQTGGSEIDYNVLYLSFGADYYGVRIGTIQGEVTLFPSQTATTIL